MGHKNNCPFFTEILQGLKTNALWTSSFCDLGSFISMVKDIIRLTRVLCSFIRFLKTTDILQPKIFQRKNEFFISFFVTPVWAGAGVQSYLSLLFMKTIINFPFSSSTGRQWKSGMGCHKIYCCGFEYVEPSDFNLPCLCKWQLRTFHTSIYIWIPVYKWCVHWFINHLKLCFFGRHTHALVSMLFIYIYICEIRHCGLETVT